MYREKIFQIEVVDGQSQVVDIYFATRGLHKAKKFVRDFNRNNQVLRARNPMTIVVHYDTPPEFTTTNTVR